MHISYLLPHDLDLFFSVFGLGFMVIIANLLLVLLFCMCSAFPKYFLLGYTVDIIFVIIILFVTLDIANYEHYNRKKMLTLKCNSYLQSLCTTKLNGISKLLSFFFYYRFYGQLKRFQDIFLSHSIFSASRQPPVYATDFITARDLLLREWEERQNTVKTLYMCIMVSVLKHEWTKQKNTI